MEHNPRQLISIARWAKTIAWLTFALVFVLVIGNIYYLNASGVFSNANQNIFGNSATTLSFIDALAAILFQIAQMLAICIVLFVVARLIPYLQKLLTQIEAQRRR